MIDDQQNYFVCVAEKNDEVLGYLIGCDIAVSGINFPENIFDLKNEKIFYHKQIVKKVGTKNIGEKLLLSMFDEARNRGYLRVICRIVHQPFYNELSVSFHQKFGFKEIAAMVEDSPSLNLVMGIYLRTL
jgi:L-amino acid N-acyltransferase YncA